MERGGGTTPTAYSESLDAEAQKVPVHRKRIIPSPHCAKLAHHDQLHKAAHRQRGTRAGEIEKRKDRGRERGGKGGRKKEQP